MKQLSQNISSTCRGDNVDIKYTTTTTTRWFMNMEAQVQPINLPNEWKLTNELSQPLLLASQTTQTT